MILAVIGVVIVGTTVVRARIERTRREVADHLEAFLEGRGGPRDWDDFVSIRIEDPELERIRVHCTRLPEQFPPRTAGEYCGPEGVEVLRRFLKQLR